MTPSVVPWVAMWSAERERQGQCQAMPGGGPIINPPADTAGVHWMPFPMMPGTGEPLFGQVHTLRQTMCMRGPRCQVCGNRFPKGEPVSWLVTDVDRVMAAVKDGGDIEGQPFHTATPPTCDDCIEVARAECPHLVSTDGGMRLRVRKFRPIAVFGDVFVGGRPVAQMDVPLDHNMVANTLGRQLVVLITDYDIVN